MKKILMLMAFVTVVGLSSCCSGNSCSKQEDTTQTTTQTCAGDSCQAKNDSCSQDSVAPCCKESAGACQNNESTTK